MLQWGATPSEVSRFLAGDELIEDPILATTRGIAIKAPCSKIWPWLAQLGQGRGGFYSYEWLENLVGLDIHNSDAIIPELQDLKVGDLMPFWRGAGVNAVMVEPNRLLVLAGTLNPARGADGTAMGGGQVGGTWAFALQEGNGAPSRLIVRSRVAKFPPAWLSAVFIRLVLEPAHFVMERQMLCGIRDRAEKHPECPGISVGQS
jgi:hypothetical protein